MVKNLVLGFSLIFIIGTFGYFIFLKNNKVITQVNSNQTAEKENNAASETKAINEEKISSEPSTLTPILVPTSDVQIIGSINSAILGNCPASVHDRYIARGPDGKWYRTWHPITVPIDSNNPNGAKCSFAHEHGDDPSTSIVSETPPLFGYIGNLVGDSEPHEGFKVFVVNAGTKDDEGRIAQNSSRLVFHMGTGGTKRFSQEFHSMQMDVVTADGKKMSLQGMADTGNVGTICSNPRQGRTVLGYGCKVTSPYEIWAIKLRITNNGEALAEANFSTAVFDPISVMDPADLTILVYVWDPQANQIFQFNDSRDWFRGCKRESYQGPIFWYNAAKPTTYYTDAYGKVVNNGPLKQYISSDSIVNYIATNDGQTQFKLKSDNCAQSIGIHN